MVDAWVNIVGVQAMISFKGVHFPKAVILFTVFFHVR